MQKKSSIHFDLFIFFDKNDIMIIIFSSETIWVS